jgi:hypothetical protein
MGPVCRLVLCRKSIYPRARWSRSGVHPRSPTSGLCSCKLTESCRDKKYADRVQFKPSIRGFDLRDINLPTLTVYSGLLGFQQTQTSPVSSIIASGLFVQYYLRNYRPRIFKDYSYLVTAALDGGSLLCIFILSFAVFGAAGSPHPFPIWWGNSAGYPDHCPQKE